MHIDVRNKQVILQGHDYNGRNLDTKVSFADLLSAEKGDVFASKPYNTARESRGESLKVELPVNRELGTYGYNEVYIEITVNGYTLEEDAEYFEYSYPFKLIL